MPNAKVVRARGGAKPAITESVETAIREPSPYEQECVAGRVLAAALIAEMVETGTSFLLGWKMKTMALEPWSGVNVGFSAYLGEKLIEGALVLP